MSALVHVAHDHEIHDVSLSINTLHYQQMSLQPLLLRPLHPLPFQTLLLRKELHQWHIDNIDRKIRKLKTHCEHDIERTSTVKLEYDHGFFYKKVVETCLKCGFHKESNETGF